MYILLKNWDFEVSGFSRVLQSPGFLFPCMPNHWIMKNSYIFVLWFGSIFMFKTPCPSAPVRCSPVASRIIDFAGNVSPVPKHATPANKCNIFYLDHKEALFSVIFGKIVLLTWNRVFLSGFYVVATWLALEVPNYDFFDWHVIPRNLPSPQQPASISSEIECI